MDLEQIRIVVAVHEHGSTLGASRALPFSRSTIRRRLAALEASLDVSLFERTAAGLAATAAGEVLASRGRELLSERDALADTIRHVGGHPRGSVRVGLPPGMPPAAVVAAQRLLHQRFPGLALSFCITARPPQQLVDRVDVAITFHAESSPLFDFTSIGRIPVRLLASPRYLAAHPPIDTVADIAAHRLLVWSPPGVVAPTHLPRQDGPDVPVQPSLTSDSPFFIRHCGAVGEGLIFAPGRQGDPLEPGPLVPVLPGIIETVVEARLAVAHVSADVPAVREMVRFIVQLAEHGVGLGGPGASL